MDWIPLVVVLAWLSTLVSLALAWMGWRRRAFLLSEWLWFVLANLFAALWTWAAGLQLLVYDPEWFRLVIILRNNAASLTALFFFATVVSASRPQWRRYLYPFVLASAAVQLSHEWASRPYWTFRPMTFGTRTVLVPLLQDLPLYMSLLGTWWPMMLFLVGLVFLYEYIRPSLRLIPWPQRLALTVWLLSVLTVQIWTLLPGSPLILKVVQVLPLSMWLLSLALSVGLLHLRFGFLGTFTPEGVLNRVREGVIVTTVDDALAWWNEVARREFHLEPQDRGLPWQERLADHPVSAWLQRGSGTQGELWTFTDDQGRTRDWLLSWLPLEDAAGVLLGHALIFDDLTNERAMQRTLHMRLQVQHLLQELLALLLKDAPLSTIASQILDLLLQPLGPYQPVMGALYAVPENPTEVGWKCYAWRGTLAVPPDHIPQPPEAWDLQQFWDAYAQAGGTPEIPGYRALVWPLVDQGRLLGALCLCYPESTSFPAEIRQALDAAAQIITHLVRHHHGRGYLLQMQQVYASMSEAVLIHAQDGRILDCNPAAEALLGAPYEDLVGHLPTEWGWRMVSPPHDVLMQQLAGQSLWQGRIRVVDAHLEGRERVLDASIVRIHTPYGEPHTRFVSVLRDVTEEERLQAVLERERAFFAQLAEVSRMLLGAALTFDEILHYTLEIALALGETDGGSLIVLDAEGQVTTVYTREGPRTDHLDFARAVVQRGAAAKVLLSRQSLIIDDTRTSDIWLHDETIVGGWRSALVVPLYHQDQALGVLTLTHREPHHFTEEHERIVHAVAELVALALHNAALYEEQFRLGRELLEAKEEAETLQRRQEQFFANLSHEMRTPLQAILGYVDVIRLEHPEMAEALSKDLDAIAGAARELLELVTQMLEFQRSRYRGQVLYPEVITLAEVVASITPVLRPLLLRQRDRLVLRITPPQLDMYTDPEKLRRIVLNLLSNAVKFTEGGEITLDIALVLREDEEEWVRIQVRDTGVGIPADKLETIFEPFEQAEPYKAGGTGLGLYLVRDFAQRLGGWVEVESEEGKGSVFTVWLPRTMPVTEGQTQPLSPDVPAS